MHLFPLRNGINPHIERGCGCDQRSHFANARAFDYPPHGAWFWCINLAAEPLKALIDLRIVFCSLVLVVCTKPPIAGGFCVVSQTPFDSLGRPGVWRLQVSPGEIL